MQFVLLLVTISVIIAWYYQIYSTPPPHLDITIVVQHQQQMFILLYCICDAKPIVLVTLALYRYLNIYLKNVLGIQFKYY